MPSEECLARWQADDMDLPAPIAEFVDATNAGDTRRFVEAFTEDAYLNDWGREFRGHSGIASWDTTDNIGKQAHFEVVSVEETEPGVRYRVTLEVSGNGYNGTGPMDFTLQDGRIS